jgi:hypothetical protein
LRLFDPESDAPSWRFERPGMRPARGARPPNRARPDLYHQQGAREFFEAVTQIVPIGQVIYTGDGGGASFLTGSTARWATGGMLREQKSSSIKPEHCQFFANMAGMGGRFGRDLKPPPGCFTNIYENSFGTLYKNNVSLRKREPVNAVVSTLNLAVLAGLGICLVLLDCWLPRERFRARLLLGVGAFVVASSCVAVLAWTAAGELRHPPQAIPGKGEKAQGVAPLVLGMQAWDKRELQL